MSGGEDKMRASGLLRIADFRLLLAGEGVSTIGGEFQFVAMSWLVFTLTGDTLALATVLAAAGIPAAIALLGGGTFSDRYSPRIVIMVAASLRMAMTLLFVVGMLCHIITLPLVYLFAIGWGVANAALSPAQQAALPQVVDHRWLRSANAIMEGLALLSCIVGPIGAGMIIAFCGRDGLGVATQDGRASGTMSGLSVVFAIDGLCCLVVIGMMMVVSRRMRTRRLGKTMPSPTLKGIASMWRDVPLRTALLVAAAANILVGGPILVGMPVLTQTRFSGGADVYGMLLAAFGAGGLLGIGVAALLPAPSPRYAGKILLVALGALGIGVIGIAVAPTASVAASIMVTMGCLEGYISIQILTWLQRRTSPDRMGRVMGAMLLASEGMTPVSAMLAGALSTIGIVTMCVVSGSLMVVIVLALIHNPIVREFG